MAATTESLIDELKTLISDKKFEKAIEFVRENEEKLKAAPQEDKGKIVDAFLRSSNQWQELLQSALESKGPSSLNSLWEMDDVNYDNYIQWLPKEVLEDIGMLFPETPQAAAHYGLFQLLVKSGGVLDLNQDEKFHGLTLDSAIGYSNNEPMARLLLENGADINAKNQAGEPLLHIAIEFKRKWMVDLLLNRGADIEITNGRGETPLHIAVRTNDLDTVVALLDKGANVNAKEKGGATTPLHMAKCTPIAKLLIDRGAEVNAQNSSGNTPLHTAVKCYNLPIIQLLKKHGANPEFKNNNNETVFSFLRSSPRFFGREGQRQRRVFEQIKVLLEGTTENASAESKLSPGSSN